MSFSGMSRLVAHSSQPGVESEEKPANNRVLFSSKPDQFSKNTGYQTRFGSVAEVQQAATAAGAMSRFLPKDSQESKVIRAEIGKIREQLAKNPAQSDLAERENFLLLLLTHCPPTPEQVSFLEKTLKQMPLDKTDSPKQYLFEILAACLPEPHLEQLITASQGDIRRFSRLMDVVPICQNDAIRQRLIERYSAADYVQTDRDNTMPLKDGLSYSLQRSATPSDRYKGKLEKASYCTQTLNFKQLWDRHIAQLPPALGQAVENMPVLTPKRDITLKTLMADFDAMADKMAGPSGDGASAVVKEALRSFLERNQYDIMRGVAEHGQSPDMEISLRDKYLDQTIRRTTLHGSDEEKKAFEETTKPKFYQYLQRTNASLADTVKLSMLVNSIAGLRHASILHSYDFKNSDLNADYLNPLLDSKKTPGELIQTISEHYLKQLAPRSIGRPDPVPAEQAIEKALDYGQQHQKMDITRKYLVYRDMMKNYPFATLEMVYKHIGPQYADYVEKKDAQPKAIQETLSQTFGNNCKGLSLLMSAVGFDGIVQAIKNHPNLEEHNSTWTISEVYLKQLEKELEKPGHATWLAAGTGLSKPSEPLAQSLQDLYQDLKTAHPDLPSLQVKNALAANLSFVHEVLSKTDTAKAKILIDAVLRIQDKLPGEAEAIARVQAYVDNPAATDNEKGLGKAVVAYHLMAEALRHENYPVLQGLSAHLKALSNVMCQPDITPSGIMRDLGQLKALFQQAAKARQLENEKQLADARASGASDRELDSLKDDQQKDKIRFSEWEKNFKTDAIGNIALAVATTGVSALKIKAEQGPEVFKKYTESIAELSRSPRLYKDMITWSAREFPKPEAVRRSIETSTKLSPEQRARALQPERPDPQQKMQMGLLLKYVANVERSVRFVDDDGKTNKRAEALATKVSEILNTSESPKAALNAAGHVIFNDMITLCKYEPLAKPNPKTVDYALTAIEDKTGFYSVFSYFLHPKPGKASAQEALTLHGELLPQLVDVEHYIKSKYPNLSLHTCHDGLKSFIQFHGTDLIKNQADRGEDKTKHLLENLKHVYGEKSGVLGDEMTRVIKSCKLKQNDMLTLLDLANGFISYQAQDKLVTLLKAVNEKAPIRMEALGKELLTVFARQHGLTCNITEETVKQWDSDVIAKVSQALKDWQEPHRTRLLKQVEATLNNTFAAGLMDVGSDIGKANLETKTLFAKHGLDFDTWMNYKAVERFTPGVSTAGDQDSLVQLALKEFQAHFPTLFNLLEPTRQTEVTGHFKHNGYEYDPKTGALSTANPDKLAPAELALLFKKMNGYFIKAKVWDQTLEKHPGEKDRLDMTRHHIAGLTEQFEKVEKLNGDTQLKTFKIGMWQRNPGKDLTLGNKTRCCIALDSGNARAMVDYLNSAATQFIEITEPKTDKTASMSLLYWIMNEQGKPECVVDVIQANKDYSVTDRNAIRDKTLEYAKQYAQAVAKQPVAVQLGQHYHTVDVTGEAAERNVKLLGQHTHSEIFLNAFQGWKKPDTAWSGKLIPL